MLSPVQQPQARILSLSCIFNTRRIKKSQCTTNIHLKSGLGYCPANSETKNSLHIYHLFSHVVHKTILTSVFSRLVSDRISDFRNDIISSKKVRSFCAQFSSSIYEYCYFCYFSCLFFCLDWAFITTFAFLFPINVQNERFCMQTMILLHLKW